MHNIGVTGVTMTRSALGVTVQSGSPLTKDRWSLSAASRDEEGRLLLSFVKDVAGCQFTAQKSGSTTWRWNKSRDALPGGLHLPTFGQTKVEKAELILGGTTLQITMSKQLEDYIPRKMRSKKKAEPQMADVVGAHLADVRLRDLVLEINRRKDEMGEDLALSVTTDGRLRAMIEYGG